MLNNNTRFKVPYAICRMMVMSASAISAFSPYAGMAQSATQSTAPKDVGWPRQVTQNGSTLVYYQPQVDEWKNQKSLKARIAFSLTPKGGANVHGVAAMHCNTLVDKDASTVYLRDIKLEDVRFPGADEATASANEKLVKELMPMGGEPISLERLMADVEQGKVTATKVAVKNDPPAIFYSEDAAVLLLIQGEPAHAPVDKTDLDFIVNTNWDVFYDKTPKTYYALIQNRWFTTTDVKGTWSPVSKLPAEMSKLPAGQNFDEAQKMIPPPAATGTAPKIFFSDQPAELIAVKGKPIYTKIPNTQLMFVSNTDNDLFLDNASQKFYVLLSGRWFEAAATSGPWSYAGDKLPADFAKIPNNSPKARVLASVPGTQAASDAVLLAQIPTTAVVKKSNVESKVKVAYDGQPEFKPIESTSMEYAVNTQEKVIKVGDMYYLCFQAVWFMSTKPNGPWKVADNVPDEIYTIPPSSPVYNVTYVTQTNVTETTVESSVTAGYFGAFIIGVGIGACIAYGTGWFYPPYMWWGPGMIYPIYRPWPCTYGGGFVYNPWTGGFAGGRTVYGPYGAAGTSAWYNPATGRYGRSASVQGWYGGRTAASSYNPWTGGYAATSQGHNAYAQWGNSVATRGGQWAQTGHITTANGTVAGYRTSTGQSGVVTHGANGTVAKGTNGTFVGHDGNVYRKNTDGGWSQYTKGGGWNPVSNPASKNISGQTRKTMPEPNHNISGQTQHAVSPDVMNNLKNSDQARQRGQLQTQRFQNMQHNFGGGRFSGGGFGGGGFRRR